MCPLCETSQNELVHQASPKLRSREFYRCLNCQLIFVPSHFHLSAEEEKNAYLRHENQVEDPNYRKFLSQLCEPLLPFLKSNALGLDYGAGPGPALAQMLREQGFSMNVFDPFFHPDSTVLETHYDFVTCSETAEHFHRPAEQFEKLGRLLKPLGILGIMTQFWTTLEAFEDWYYHRDPTHVSFYHQDTMEWIAKTYDWEILKLESPVAIFKVRN